MTINDKIQSFCKIIDHNLRLLIHKLEFGICSHSCDYLIILDIKIEIYLK
jgi:hypothetical protein